MGRVEELLIERRGRYEGMILGRTRRNKAAVMRGGEHDIGHYRTAELVRTTGATFVAEPVQG